MKNERAKKKSAEHITGGFKISCKTAAIRVLFYQWRTGIKDWREKAWQLDFYLRTY